MVHKTFIRTGIDGDNFYTDEFFLPASLINTSQVALAAEQSNVETARTARANDLITAAATDIIVSGTAVVYEPDQLNNSYSENIVFDDVYLHNNVGASNAGFLIAAEQSNVETADALAAEQSNGANPMVAADALAAEQSNGANPMVAAIEESNIIVGQVGSISSLVPTAAAIEESNIIVGQVGSISSLVPTAAEYRSLRGR